MSKLYTPHKGTAHLIDQLLLQGKTPTEIANILFQEKTAILRGQYDDPIYSLSIRNSSRGGRSSTSLKSLYRRVENHIRHLNDVHNANITSFPLSEEEKKNLKTSIGYTS